MFNFVTHTTLTWYNEVGAFMDDATGTQGGEIIWLKL